MPTILEALEAALEALKCLGYGEGGALYDDLKQAIAELKEGASLKDRLTK
jgi:hypothetical protein